ncbi:hypothetical protein GCM10017781_29760 [Deinococcus metalli]|uniref:Malectin domain-containing protein n=1 Tax=Deinococcus metalli TaxID=1141878 RepID=A0ABQ3JRE2_9DEIO|nr:hypothetical protein GCM10017781_29760 [Deinococcus metalli]
MALRPPGRAAGLLLTALLAACTTPPTAPTPPGTSAPATSPVLSTENLDAFPVSGGGVTRLAFSRIHDNSGGQCIVGGQLVAAPCTVHDHATVRIHNIGAGPATLSSPQIDPAWTLDPGVAFPLQVAPGGSVDLPLTFVGDQAPTLPPRLYTGTFSVTTNDPGHPTLSVQLAGLWQATSERSSASNAYDEPSLELIRQALSVNVALSSPGDAPPTNDADPSDGSLQPYNRWGAVVAQGDEMLSAYWEAADPTRPVTVRQIGAWSGQTEHATLAYYAKGAPGTLHPLIERSAADSAQTLFPLGQGSATPGPSNTFTPGGPFGFNVTGDPGSGNAEFSDATLNRQRGQTGGDDPHGCEAYTTYANAPDNTDLCGQHLRFWPLTDASGARIPDAYMMAVDYQGVNDDYQDELYVMTNLKPAPILLKMGHGGAPYVGSDGRVWLPDRVAPPTGDTNVYFTPAQAVDEPATPYSGPVGNTTDPGLYRTYRGNVGAVPQAQRRLTYSIPIDDGTYGVKLYFVDQASTHAGERVFDVSAQGQVVIHDLDIYQESGGQDQALVRTLPGVSVTGGVLTLTLSASADYPALSAIEIDR